MADRLDDRELMTRFGRHEDRAAFEELARRWDRPILAFLAKSCGDLEAAEDLRQEVFVRLCRRRARYDPRYAFSTWLFRIASNALKTWQGAEARRRRSVSSESEAGEMPDPADPSPDPRQRLARSESTDRVREAMARLPVEDRELLLLRFDLDFTYRKIGEVLGAPETTVKSRLYTLLAKLRRQLNDGEMMERTLER